MMTSTALKTRTLPLRKLARYYSAPTDSSIPSSKVKFVPTSGSYPKGFWASGTHVGVKASNTSKPDLALISSDVPCNAAAVFTQNKFQAAPVQVSKSVLSRRGGRGVQSVIINSGCANAVTGQGGMDDAIAMAEAATSVTNSNLSDDLGPSSLVMSTGVIGQRLPIDKILSGVPTAHSNLGQDHNAWLSTAKAIMTTDTFPKLLSESFTLPSFAHKDIKFSLAGMTKGAGMIHPNMATLLSICCTDAPISPSALKSLLTTAVQKSFNSISIDGDSSTNDTLALLANGAAAKKSSPLTPSLITSPDQEDYQAFSEILNSFTQRLSHLVVRDGEGATKFICVHVRNAPSYNDAHVIASSVARSPLVKTALYGRDANWGRVLCAVGYSQGLSSADVVVPDKTSVSFIPANDSKSKDEGVLRLLVNGEPEKVDEGRAARLLEDEDLNIDIDLGTGTQEAKYWFCDFSHEYVTINGDYRT